MRELSVSTHGGRLSIQWPWKVKGNFFLLAFSIVWNVITLFVVAGIFLSEGFSLLAILPLSFHLLIGLFMLYFSITRYVNKTEVSVDHQSLTVDLGPLPWFGKKNIKSSELEQLFVIKDGSESAGSVKTDLYAVRAKLKNGKQLTIVSGLRSQERGLEIERLIEDYLKIKDEPVSSGFERLEEKFKQYFPNTTLPPLPGPINDKSGRASSTDFNTANPSSSFGGPTPPPRVVPTDLLDPLANGKGATMTLRHLNYEIAAVTQFDWNNNTTDRSGELRGGAQQTGFYSEDRGTRDRYFFEERPLAPKEFLRIGLGNPNNMPHTFTNGDEKYHQREVVDGYAYHEGSDSYAVRQWLYFTTASHTRFRVLECNGEMTVYIQEPVALKELA